MKVNRYITYIALGILILSLIPLYYIGQYAHPSVDDYYYGIETSRVWSDTGSFYEVLKESFLRTQETYHAWQGNFSAIFLMRLQPAIFGENYYFITPVIFITSFVISMLVFFYFFLRKWWNSGKIPALLASTVITFCALQFTLVPSDSFYWYNGSVYYTFFFSLMLFLFFFITIMLKGEHRAARILSGIFAVILGFFIGGGNYATALFTVLVLCVITLIYIIRKDRCKIFMAVITVFSLAGLILSVIAPGNEIRQASVGEGYGVVKAILYSFAYGGYNIASSTTAPVLVMWLLLLPVFYRIASGSSFNFRYPLAVLIFTFGLFCSQATPVFYAQGMRMPYRMMNIICFSYYIFMTFNLIYIMGWLYHRFRNNGLLCAASSFFKKSRNRLIYASFGVMAFIVGCIGLCSVSESEDGSAQFGGMPLSVSAVYSIINNDARTYDDELNERAEYLSTTTESDVVVKPLSVTPDPIFHTDITTDSAHWKNAHLALFYNKASVTLSDE